MKRNFLRFVSVCVLLFASACPALAAESEVNVYSARHYEVDKVLYDNFT
jgi:hypothetical protein